MTNGPQQGLFHLDFCTPAECADRLESGQAEIGIVPVIEAARMGLQTIPGACIACRGAVRSILLVTKVPLTEIRTFAADSSSRTSVALARVILSEVYGVEPRFLTRPPDIDAMLTTADAALLIGDPALRVDPATMPYEVRDLGEEWSRWTGLPMVFAVWACRPGMPVEELEAAFRGSAEYGREHIDDYLSTEAARRGIPEPLARDYLTRHIHFELGDNERQGIALFLEHASRGVSV